MKSGMSLTEAHEIIWRELKDRRTADIQDALNVLTNTVNDLRTIASELEDRFPNVGLGWGAKPPKAEDFWENIKQKTDEIVYVGVAKAIARALNDEGFACDWRKIVKIMAKLEQ